jgi:hypothetical protein
VDLVATWRRKSCQGGHKESWDVKPPHSTTLTCALKQLPITMSASAEYSSGNVLGAIVFFSYIVTALGLTLLILSDLSKAYGTFSRSKANTIHRSNLILIFASFAAISLSSLAYHMLNVLIYSYAQWAADKNIALPGTFMAALKGLTNESFSSNIWTWAKSTTLFQDFAEVIFNDPVRFWWTQQALLLSIGWNTFMAIEGKLNNATSILESF